MAIITLQSTHTPSGKSRSINLTTIATPQPGDWPNHEPAGFTPIYQITGSTKDWSTQSVSPWLPGSGWTADNKHIEVLADPASKFGNVVAKHSFVNYPSGWLNSFNRSVGAPFYRELYCRLIAKYSANWDYHVAGEKLLLCTQDGRHGMALYSKGGRLAFGSENGQTVELGPGATDWYPLLNGETAIPGVGIIQQPVKRINRDEFFVLECHKWASLTPGTGGFRMWIDGEEFTRFIALGKGVDLPGTGWTWLTGESLSDKRLRSQLEAPMFWGGQVDVKQANDSFFVSELYMSGRN